MAVAPPRPVPSSTSSFPPGYFGHLAAFSPAGTYGGWLLSLPVGIRINDTLFMHAGPARDELDLDLAQLNLRYRAVLADYIGLGHAAGAGGLLQPGDDFYDRPQLARSRLERRPRHRCQQPAGRSVAALRERGPGSAAGRRWPQLVSRLRAVPRSHRGRSARPAAAQVPRDAAGGRSYPDARFARGIALRRSPHQAGYGHESRRVPRCGRGAAAACPRKPASTTRASRDSSRWRPRACSSRPARWWKPTCWRRCRARR